MNSTLDSQLQIVQRSSLTVASAFLGALLIGGYFDPEQLFRSYLLGLLFWLAFPLGSLGILMLHNLTGGAWGLPLRRVLESACQTFSVLAVLWIPLIFGLKHLYIWALPEVVSGDRLLQAKSVYLNPEFFVLRGLLYFAVWILLGHFLCRWSLQQDKTGDPSLTDRLQRFSGPGLVLCGGTITFAAVDWVMSLEPHWYSTIFGLLFVVGQVLSALAFMILTLWWLARFPPLSSFVADSHFHDLGNLLLAFVMLWAYMGFSQYLIVWSGNLPEETSWYLHRTSGGWQWTALFLVCFHFAIPFLVLLSRKAKRRAGTLCVVALAVLGARFVDLLWLVVPSLQPSGFSLHWMDLAAAAGLGGAWVAAFVRQVKNKPLVPLQDPRFSEVAAGIMEGPAK